MRPIIFKGNILLPIPGTVGELKPGQYFKRSFTPAKYSALRIVISKSTTEVIAKKVYGSGTERMNRDYPVVKLI